MDNGLVEVLPSFKRTDAHAEFPPQIHARTIEVVNDAVHNYLGTVRSFLNRAIPSNKNSMSTLRQGVWSDLSAVYYKYEDDDQKQAFREILSEISERLNEGKWDKVYKKLHFINQRN